MACLEGFYAAEFARRGAKVLGIEGRSVNFERSLIVKDAFKLDNLQFALDDVRNLSKEKYGVFDVVLCLGILYHLDVPDVFIFLERVAEVCNDFLLIDTHVGSQEKCCVYKGIEYWGSTYSEDLSHPWSSIGNPNSFWFVRSSLYKILSVVGFTSVYECHVPFEPDKPTNRVTLLAMRNQPLFSIGG